MTANAIAENVETVERVDAREAVERVGPAGSADAVPAAAAGAAPVGLAAAGPAPAGSTAPDPARLLPYARPAGFGAPQAWHTLPALNPALAGFYHLITFGLFGLFHYQGLHDRLPKNRKDDPSSAKAIGLMFVPLFNFYWMFFAGLRLQERIDEQRRLAGLAERPLKALCIAMLVMLFIPYVNVFSLLVVHPVYIASLQASINELCLATARRPNGVFP